MMVGGGRDYYVEYYPDVNGPDRSHFGLQLASPLFSTSSYSVVSYLSVACTLGPEHTPSEIEEEDIFPGLSIVKLC